VVVVVAAVVVVVLPPPGRVIGSVIGSVVGIGSPPPDVVVVELAEVAVVQLSAGAPAGKLPAAAARTASTLPPIASGMAKPTIRLSAVPVTVYVLSAGGCPRGQSRRCWALRPGSCDCRAACRRRRCRYGRCP